MIKFLTQIVASIGAKIILPYVILTLIVASVGAYIVTQLVVSTTQERVENQLLVAGRAVAEQIVEDEQDRLRILLALVTAAGIPEALADGDVAALRESVPLMGEREGATAVSVVDRQGVEVVGWQRDDSSEGTTTTNIDFSNQPDVMRVLEGMTDEFGDKRAILVGESPDFTIFTVGPVVLNGEVVGAALVGTELHELALDLANKSLAHITFYDQEGGALATSLVGESEETLSDLTSTPEQYHIVLERLHTSPEFEGVVIAEDDDNTLLRRIDVQNQTYLLAFGDWRLRGQSFGLFSVALSADFITISATTSRNLLAGIFFIATLAVFVVGFVLAQRITGPIRRLVVVSTAVAQGDLEQHTDIQRNDEIGVLANSFDIMTQNLAQRNRQLVEQAIELEAILHSISDAVIVFNNDNEIVASNPAAEKLLKHLTYDNDAPATYLQSSKAMIQSDLNVNTLMALETAPTDITRFRIGSRVFGLSASPFKTPDGNELGKVIVLRDETRQVESEQLKDGFITSISHELRTPLTPMKGYLHLLQSKNAENLTAQQLQFVEIIQNSTELLVSHVNKLIDITSIQDGSLRLEKKRHSLTEIVQQQVDEWRDKMQDKDLDFAAELGQEPLWIMTDRERLDWAIDNILRNANYYTLSGGKVTVCLSVIDEHACLQVRDTGVGISEVDQPYIFTRFYRAQNELTLHVPGLGIELFVAKSIVEAHDGRIWVESELGKGSTFGIELILAE